MKRTARSAIVEHAAREMFELVEDIESYPKFLPWCLDARVHERNAAGTLATLTVGLRGLKQSFTTQNANRAGESIEMRLLRGPFRHFFAAWRFRAAGEHACHIEFSMEYEFASRTLGKLLAPLFEHIADTMVDAFTRRAG